MGRLSDLLSTMRARTGRLITEQGFAVNTADTARKFNGLIDPFGSLRTTEYRPIFSTQPIDVSIISDRTFTSGAASITVVNGEYKLSNPGGETCRLESSQRGRYQAGILGVPGLGARRGVAPSGTTVYRVGYFDTDDGFGFKEDSSGLHTFVRQGGVEIYTKPRANWLDPLDGTGESGRSIDLDDGRIYRMPFAWYGYGTISFGIVATHSPSGDDELIVVDRWSPTGEISFPNPNLPVSAEISGDTAGELYIGGRQYGVYGDLNLRRRIVGELRTGQSVASADGFVPVLSARTRDLFPWNRIPIQTSGISLETDTDLDWIIIVGGTLNNNGDANWNISQFTQGDSSVEFNTSITTLSGGEILSGPRFVRGGAGVNVGSQSSDIPSQDIPIGEPITLAVRAHSGTATVRSALRMAELR